MPSKCRKKFKGLPSCVWICGIPHAVTYLDYDHGEDEDGAIYVGQYDPGGKTITVYTKGKPTAEVLDSLLHEILHGLALTAHLTTLEKIDGSDTQRIADQKHRDLARLATLLADTLVRSKIIKLKD